MDPHLTLKATSIPYLEKDIIEKYATLKFCSLDNNVLAINPLMLVALKSRVISNMQDEECSVFTEFTIEELNALNDFICTGNCNMTLARNVFASLGIDLEKFYQTANSEEVSVKELIKSEILEVDIKEEVAVDDFKENEPEDLEDVPLKKRVRNRPNSNKVKSKSSTRIKRKTNKNTIVVYDGLPTDYELPQDISNYKESPTETYNKNQSKTMEGSDFSCVPCGVSFSTSSTLEDHKTRIHQEHLKCPLCQQIFKTCDSEPFKLHMYNHEENSSSHKVCVQCGKLFFKVKQLSRHHQLKGPFHDDQCAQCPKVLQSHEEYKDHIKSEHFGLWLYKCGFCKENFESIKSLRDHVSYNHKGRVNRIVSKKKGKKTEKKVCEECGKSVVHLRQHMQLVHEIIDLQLPCPHCKSVYKSQRCLSQHIALVHTKDPCPDCGKLVGRRDMSRHKMASHTREKNFKCDVCGKSFITTQRLNDHKNIHTGEKPYKCKYCSACFANGGTLGMHQRSHLGYKRPTKS